MTTLPRWVLACAVVLPLVALSCSSDDSPSDGGTLDTTPPAITSVTPVDAYHVEVTFSEEVTKSTAEDDGNYLITEAAAPAPAPSGMERAPGDPMTIAGITLKDGNRTATLSTESSMSGLPFDISIEHVEDARGNAIATPIVRSFTGSATADVNMPLVVNRSPAANATNVPVGTTVLIQFSEAVTSTSFGAGVSWTAQTGPVPFTVQRDGTTFVLTPTVPLANSALQTVTLIGVQDYAGNTLTDTEWSFTITSVPDQAPPALVSTSPVNNANGVDVNTNLSLTFSEAISPVEFDVAFVPDPGAGIRLWSNGGRTMTFNPANPLLDDQQYTFTIFPNGVRDLAGNGFEGLLTVKFTTGGALERGSFAGLVTGDPGSAAADPTGAVVIAADAPLDPGPFHVMGSATVAGNNTYTLARLPDAVYYIVAVMNTHDDGYLDPGRGDALGAYGVDSWPSAEGPDSVTMLGGVQVQGIDFRLTDPSAIRGTVTYSGAHAAGSYTVHVGIDTTASDPSVVPVAGTQTLWPDTPEWSLLSIDQAFLDDPYYVRAFLDVNQNGLYDPGSDPSGWYGGTSPATLNVTQGADFSDIVIPLADPPPGMAGSAVTWPPPKHHPVFQRICEIARRGQSLAK